MSNVKLGQKNEETQDDQTQILKTVSLVSECINAHNIPSTLFTPYVSLWEYNLKTEKNQNIK